MIVDRATLEGRSTSLVRFAQHLRDAGVRLLQYRDKQGSPQDVLRGAAAISDVFAGTDAMLVMNDRADLAMLAGWRGVHVGHLDMPPEAVKRLLCGERDVARAHPSRQGPRDEWGTQGTGTCEECLVGVSTHNDEQVRAADAGAANYIAIGPVFTTSSKADTEPVVGLDGVRRARALTRKPLVAIGGITRANARAVIDAGADSVAVIGGLFAAGESVADVARDFLRILG